MDQDTLAAPTLYDLLARVWQLPAGIDRVLFDAAGSAAAFVLADGRVAVAPAADPEDAETRIRVELDSGRSTIRPRQGAVAPLQNSEPFGDGPCPLAPLDARGFVAADGDGALHQITPRGQVVRLRRGDGGAAAALASDPARGLLALAAGDRVTLLDGAAMAPLRVLEMGDAVTGLAFSPDGARLAVTSGATLTLVATGDGDRIAAAMPIAAAAGAPRFSADGAWLAGQTADGALWLAHPETGRGTVIGNFPIPPSHIGFSAAAEALVASGAFRLTAWSLDRPPLNGDNSGALRTGRAGLVTVTTAAVHPTRDLAAAGTAGGLVVLNRVGQADELVIRPDDGRAATALAWSPDGRLLALGLADGGAALVAFPTQIFK